MRHSAVLRDGTVICCYPVEGQCDTLSDSDNNRLVGHDDIIAQSHHNISDITRDLLNKYVTRQYTGMGFLHDF